MSNLMENIRQLERFAPRRMEGERLAAEFIKSRLGSLGVDFQSQKFKNQLPHFTRYSLKADGETVECMPTALRSGEITGRELISSVSVSSRFYEEPNINFNPYSDGFSLATFYRAPSLTIKRKDVQRIINAGSVEGSVRVTKKPHSCENILAGNTKNPKNILISHTDSVLGGALDNASGTSILLELSREARRDTMFLFSGCEEMSFDEPAYWGRGYRVFEEQFKGVMRRAKRIVVVDMVGSNSPALVEDRRIRMSAFPIRDPELWEKALIVGTGGDEWKPIYHSTEDKIGLIKERYLEESMRMVERLMK
ncbi:MAG TPA: M28 family peptidase [Candidatus Acidoferrales bacterium]|nr:M28 family peptidase [Candidatus Acidoferrales bacterium]